MVMSGYQPIPCVEHEKLEYAVLKRQRLRLSFRDEAGARHDLLALPTDVATRDGAEWLSYRDEAGGEGVLRLDRLLSFDAA